MNGMQWLGEECWLKGICCGAQSLFVFKIRCHLLIILLIPFLVTLICEVSKWFLFSLCFQKHKRRNANWGTDWETLYNACMCRLSVGPTDVNNWWRYRPGDPLVMYVLLDGFPSPCVGPLHWHKVAGGPLWGVSTGVLSTSLRSRRPTQPACTVGYRGQTNALYRV